MSHGPTEKPRLMPPRSVALAILQRLIAYHEGDADALESLGDLLQGDRVAAASVREALGLLADGLVPDLEELMLSPEPRDPRRRVLTEQERDTLTQEAQGYLMRLAADGRIGAGEMEDVLQPGRRQVAAGCIIYGSSTMLVYTTGQGAHGFTLDPSIGEFLLSHPNMPEDKVPVWDFDAPDTPNAPTPRDASAAAVMASALLQLSSLVGEPDKARYQTFALEILKSLASPAYAAALGQNSHFLLMHSVGHLPNNSEIDVAINYADYYYLEALLRCRALAEN